MPAMGNITVLNAAGANVVYNASTPSAGDTVPAVWTADAAAAQIGFRPKLSVSTRNNAKGTARVFRGTFKFPITGTDTTTGQPFLIATVPFEISGTLPTNADAATVNDAFVQLTNLLASTLIRSVAGSGYAPT